MRRVFALSVVGAALVGMLLGGGLASVGIHNPLIVLGACCIAGLVWAGGSMWLLGGNGGQR